MGFRASLRSVSPEYARLADFQPAARFHPARASRSTHGSVPVHSFPYTTTFGPGKAKPCSFSHFAKPQSRSPSAEFSSRWQDAPHAHSCHRSPRVFSTTPPHRWHLWLGFNVLACASSYPIPASSALYPTIAPKAPNDASNISRFSPAFCRTRFPGFFRLPRAEAVILFGSSSSVINSPLRLTIAALCLCRKSFLTFATLACIRASSSYCLRNLLEMRNPFRFPCLRIAASILREIVRSSFLSFLSALRRWRGLAPSETSGSLFPGSNLALVRNRSVPRSKASAPQPCSRAGRQRIVTDACHRPPERKISHVLGSPGVRALPRIGISPMPERRSFR